jgi:hypothetical protein
VQKEKVVEWGKEEVEDIPKNEEREELCFGDPAPKIEPLEWCLLLLWWW